MDASRKSALRLGVAEARQLVEGDIVYYIC